MILCYPANDKRTLKTYITIQTGLEPQIRGERRQTARRSYAGAGKYLYFIYGRFPTVCHSPHFLQYLTLQRRWSIVSKSSRGLYLLDADLKREFRYVFALTVTLNGPFFYLRIYLTFYTLYTKLSTGGRESFLRAGCGPIG